jgi:hypothetical protein
MPIARVLGLTRPYHGMPMVLSPEQVALLGTKPDSVLAGEWGVASVTVNKTRRMLGLTSPGNKHRRNVLMEKLKLLTDDELCQPLEVLVAQTKLSFNVLTAERRRRGIRGSPRGGSPRVDIITRRIVALKALREEYPAITLEELAEVFNLTRERVRQLELAEQIEHRPWSVDTEYTASERDNEIDVRDWELAESDHVEGE